MTLSGSTSTAYRVDLAEFAGLTGLDQHPAGIVDHAGRSPAKAPALTPTASGELFVVATGAKSAKSGTPGGGFTALATTGSGTSLGYLVATDALAHQFTQTLSPASTWSGLAVSFLSAAPQATYDVTVSGPGGTSATMATDRFTYTGV